MSRQLLLEQEMLDSGVRRYFDGVERAKKKQNALGKTVDISDESNTSYGISIMKYFIDSIADCIRFDLQTQLGKPGRKPIAWEYLATVNVERAAFITAKTIIDSISRTVKLTSLVIKIAAKLEDNCRFEALEAADRKYLRSTQRYIKEQKITDYRTKRSALIHSAQKSDKVPVWDSCPITDKAHIGTALLEAFIKATSDYDAEGNRIVGTAFVEKYSQRQFKKVTYVIVSTPKAHAWIKANQDVCKEMYPDYMPCIEPPIDWTSPTHGGFHSPELQRRKPLVKMQRPQYLKEMRKHVDKMDTFYRTVNTLQKTKWEVNSFVYEQMRSEFQRNDGIDMPSPEPLVTPPNPLPPLIQGDMTNREFIEYRKYKKEILTYEEKVAFAQWNMKAKEIKFKEIERSSKAMQISRTLNVASQFKNEDAIYFVWTADFRGRLYAAGTALSPQGTEKSKALLKFARGVRLGKHGLKHLKYHAAGVFGVDKCTLEERIQFVDSHKQEIITTGLNPDNARDFWKQADKPYLFLAVCQELAECFIMGGDNEDFISHIPCAQDGSCNGIQNYSAMLCDPTGGIATNLMDSLSPGDIYTDASNKIIEYLHHAIDKGETWDGKEWNYAPAQDVRVAQAWLTFGIERSCTKKPTMVIPYGGTKIGCRDTCFEYLRELTNKRQKDNPDYTNPFVDMTLLNDQGEVSDSEKYAITYLHHLVWKALDVVVIAARTAMKFLKDVTARVVKDGKLGNMIQWTTPTGFIVYQDIKNMKPIQIKTHLEGRIDLSFRTELKSIDTRRMQTSIAPNFVHSMDSSHLQMCINLGSMLDIKDFCVVHDSFGAHAGRCEDLHIAIRRSFVEMHRHNLLETFWYDQVQQNPHLMEDMPAISDVKRGSLDLNKVLVSTHFFR